MTQILVVILSLLNVALIIAVIAVIGARPKYRFKDTSDELEGLNMIEFQQNLKELIGQLKEAGEESAEKAAVSKEKLESLLRDADKAAKELKYLIDRTRMMRESEYKSEVGKTARVVVSNTDEIIPKEQKKEKVPESRFDMAADNEPDSAAKASENTADWVKGLLKSGISPEEISVITGISRGEIELIKNLKK